MSAAVYTPVSEKCEGNDERWAVLGGLRFALALVVLIGHARYNAPTCRWMQNFAQFGSFAAVLGFFVVSGYSIAHSYHQEPSGFFARRIHRLYPAYFAAFLLSLVPYYLLSTDLPFHDPPDLSLPTVPQFVANGLCLPGTLAPAISSNMPFWSLGAEVVYYALTPLLFRLRNRALAGLAVASMTLYFAHSCGWFGWGRERYPSESHGVAALCLLWAWLGGFLLWRHPDAEWVRWSLAGSGCVLLGFDDTQHASLSVAVFLAASLAVVYARRIPVPARVAPWLRYAGDLSYPLYLTHYPLLSLLHSWGGLSAPAPLLLIPLLAAVLFHHGVELPLRRRARPGPPVVRKAASP